MNAIQPWVPRVVRALGALVTATLILAACSSPAASPTPSAVPSTAPSLSPSVAATPTATAVPSPSEEPGIGSEVIVGDQQKVQVTAVEAWAGSSTQQPAAGNAFVSVKITVTGITTTSFTSADFAVRDPEGNSHAEAAPGRAPQLSFQTGLEPQHFYAGYVTFEVPAADVGSLVLVYTPNFLTTTYEIKLS
jgi:hypothetical protein